MSKKKREAPAPAEAVREDYDALEWGNIELPGLSDEELHGKDWEKSQRMKDLYSDPKHRKRMAQIAKQTRESEEWKRAHREALNDPEHKKLLSKINKERWQDPEYREQYMKIMQSNEHRQKMSRLAKKRELDPEYRKKIKESNSKHYAKGSERNRKLSEIQKRVWDDPEVRQKHGEQARERWAKKSDSERKAIIEKRSQGDWLKRVKEGQKRTRKPMMCDGVAYGGVTVAARALGVDAGTIAWRRNNWPERYYYISKEEYERYTKS